MRGSVPGRVATPTTPALDVEVATGGGVKRAEVAQSFSQALLLSLWEPASDLPFSSSGTPFLRKSADWIGL